MTDTIAVVRWTAAVACLIASVAAAAERRFPVEGMVLRVDRAGQTVLVSHEQIPGFMDAMVMPFAVRSPDALAALKPGARIRFTLNVGKDSSWIDGIEVVAFDSPATDPLQARRFRALEDALGASATTLQSGDRVPDFALTDQTGRAVRLSQFAGRVVALNFVYTRCPLPDYCLRSSNNFGRLQARFGDRLGRDLVLLTISFDPVHDQPSVLASYGRIWKADARYWRFLTGASGDVQRVCAMFGVGYWPDEGIMTHSVHAVVIDRGGRMAANLEGNQYSARQLGDLVESVIAGGR